jgi:hypothetical protein
LVVLDEQDVVAAPRYDLGADVPLAEQSIPDEDPAGQRQDAQQLQGGLVLVGLAIDADLGEDRLGVRGIDRDEVLAGGLAIPATP